jgi:hypothetical protein
MATQAIIGYLSLGMQAFGGSPIAYPTLEEVLSASGIGQTASQVDVTNWDSAAGSKEFIAGLKEGDEVTVECNHRPAGVEQLKWIAAAVAGQTRAFRLTYLGVSPNKKVNFSAAVLGYTYMPSATEQSKIQFRLKISGEFS